MTAPEGRFATDFTLGFVLEACLKGRLLTPAQVADVTAKEAQARQRVMKLSGHEKYEVSPVEIVAAFQVAHARPGPGSSSIRTG